VLVAELSLVRRGLAALLLVQRRELPPQVRLGESQMRGVPARRGKIWPLTDRNDKRTVKRINKIGQNAATKSANSMSKTIPAISGRTIQAGRLTQSRVRSLGPLGAR
jgi:hypothetical protein